MFEIHKLNSTIQNQHFPGAIDLHNGIWIETESSLLFYLTEISPSQCGKYIYFPIDEWARLSSAMIMRKDRQLVEAWNVTVAERMTYVNEYIQRSSMSETCR